MLLRQICTRAYNRAVDNVHLLNNHYKAFSSQTYGETSFDRMQMIIQEIVPKVCEILIRLIYENTSLFIFGGLQVSF